MITADLGGCIFGLNGVLVDTARYHMEAWRRLAEALGIELPANAEDVLRHLTRMECLEKILDWGGGQFMTDAEKMFWSDVKNNWYVERIAAMRPGEVLPGVVYFLRQLRGEGLKTAVVSDSANALSVLKSVQLDTFFDVVIDGQTSRKGKSSPEPFLLAAKALGLSPEECLVFEDSPLGILTAGRIGFSVVGVGREVLPGAAVTVASFEGLNFHTLAERALPELV